MNIIPNDKNRIHSVHFNPKQYYGTMSNEEKAHRQNSKIYAKYNYLEKTNKHRKILLITFTSKDKNLPNIQKIRDAFLRYIKTDLTIKNSYAYIWSIQLGKEQNNPHLHIMFWYDDFIYQRIKLHYEKTLKKFDLNKKRSPLTNQKNAKPYVLNEFSSNSNDMVYHYLIRKNTAKSYNMNIRYIGFSSFKHSKKIYDKSYRQYEYNYLLTDKMFEENKFTLWDKKYLIKTLELSKFILYLLLKYQNIIIKTTNYQKITTQSHKQFFTLSLKYNKKQTLLARWQLPFAFVFT